MKIFRIRIVFCYRHEIIEKLEKFTIGGLDNPRIMNFLRLPNPIKAKSDQRDRETE